MSSPRVREIDLQFELSVFSYGKQHHGQSAMMLEQFSWWDKLARSNSKLDSVIDSAKETYHHYKIVIFLETQIVVKK